MENDAATLYCPNELCQAANPLTHKFCQRCSTPLPKRFLWAVGENSIVGKSWELLEERYLIIEKNVLLDTKPGLLPQIPEQQKLDDIKSYLRLIPYRLHIPQVYGLLSLNNGNTKREILLLEKPPLIVDEVPTKVGLCPELTAAWKNDATSLRQLNWLWQISQLWQPLASGGVVSSLLTTKLIRVEGSILRLLELNSDGENIPSLRNLGDFWQNELLPQAKPAIRDFMTEVCRLLIKGKVHSSEQLTALLDKGIASLQEFYQPTITALALTDTGPNRPRNEDACYPESGISISKPPLKSVVTIVCDGIGGHEGGNVASNLAIETIQQQIGQLPDFGDNADNIDSTALLTDLEHAAAAANDKISQLNDSENRQGRQRMGTTVVMALSIAHQMYITHVGDSRAYLITRNNCHQITLDDDVASREVRLGYAVYRDAVNQAASGSLIQALGMNSSNALHPTAQRFILDEDCVFLLCSDGLSDFDRVEQHWDTEILPLLDNHGDVTSVTKQLLEIANNQNGHDNVTISVIHCQIKYSEPKSALQASLADISLISPPHSSRLTAVTHNILDGRTQIIPEKNAAKSLKLVLGVGIISLLAMVGVGFGYFWRQGIFSLGSASPDAPSEKSEPIGNIPQIPSGKNDKRKNIDKGWLIITKDEINNLSKSATPPPDEDTSAKEAEPIYAPPASTLLVTQKEQISSTPEDYRLQIKVCSVGEKVTPKNSSTTTATNTDSKVLLKPGQEVWLKFSQLTSSNATYLEPDEVRKQCSPPDTSEPDIEDDSTELPVKDSSTRGKPSIKPEPVNTPGEENILTPTSSSTDSKTR